MFSSISIEVIYPGVVVVKKKIALSAFFVFSKEELLPRASFIDSSAKSTPVESGTSFAVIKSPPNRAAVSMTFGPSFVRIIS